MKDAEIAVPLELPPKEEHSCVRRKEAQ